ncbi:MAG: DUF302 domain-containing protein [Planctomycetota bacterium]|jgi:uncharacterized protein (DUF302 family)
MKGLVVFLLGLLIGAGAVFGFLVTQGPKMMIEERASPVDLDETVRRITTAAEAEGWVVQSIVNLEESIKKNGGGDVLPVRLVNLCQANHAAQMMRVDDARRVSLFMPCTISVYEKSDGKVYVSSMNAGLLGRLFGGVVSEVMAGEVADAQERFVAAVDAPTPETP